MPEGCTLDNSSLGYWRGILEDVKQEMAGKDKLSDWTDKWTNKKHIQSVFIKEEGGEGICGSSSELFNPIKLPRAVRMRFAWAQRPERQEIESYHKYKMEREAGQRRSKNKWKKKKNGCRNFKAIKQLTSGLTHAFSACTRRWRQPPAEPARAAEALGLWRRAHLCVSKQMKQAGPKSVFYQQNLYSGGGRLTAAGTRRIHRTSCNVTSVSSPSIMTPGHNVETSVNVSVRGEEESVKLGRRTNLTCTEGAAFECRLNIGRVRSSSNKSSSWAERVRWDS